MENYEHLISAINKEDRLPASDKDFYVHETTVKSDKPTISLKEWQRYKVVQGVSAEFNQNFKFLFTANRSEFQLQVVSDVEVTKDVIKQEQLVRMAHAEGGLKKYIRNQLSDAFKQFSISLPGGRMLTEIIRFMSTRGEGMSEIDRTIMATLNSCGLETNFVRVTALAWNANIPSIEIRRKDLQVRLSDISERLSVQLDGVLHPKTKSEAYYTTALSPNQGSDSIEKRVIEAIRLELGGTSLQDWIGAADIDADESITTSKAQEAANREAAKYGWTLGHGLVVQSDVGIYIRKENFDDTNDYKLPGVGRRLTIIHKGAYKLTNAARYEQLKKTQSECENFREFIINQAREVTVRKLQISTYAAAIELISNHKQFEKDIREELSVIIKNYGHECVTYHATVDNLPERKLLNASGYKTTILDRNEEFQLSIPGRQTKLGLEGRLKLVAPHKLEPELKEHDSLEDIVGKIAVQARVIVRSFLNSLDPEKFRLSDLSTQVRLDEDTVEEHIDPLDNSVSQVRIYALEKNLIDLLIKEIDSAFGIEFTDVKILKGDEPLRARADELKNYKGEIVARNILIKSEVDHALRKINSSIFYSIDNNVRKHESKFAADTLRYSASIEDHIQALETTIQRNFVNLLEHTRYEYFRGHFKAAVIEIICRIVRSAAIEQHGIAISIDPTSFSIDVPDAANTENIRLLNTTIDKLAQKQALLFAQITEDPDPEDLERITNHISQIDVAINQVKAKQEENKSSFSNTSLTHTAEVIASLDGFRLAIASHVDSKSLPKSLISAADARLAQIAHTQNEDSLSSKKEKEDVDNESTSSATDDTSDDNIQEADFEDASPSDTTSSHEEDDDSVIEL